MLFPIKKSHELHEPIKKIEAELEAVLEYVTDPMNPDDFLSQTSAIAIANDAAYIHDLYRALSILKKSTTPAKAYS